MMECVGKHDQNPLGVRPEAGNNLCRLSVYLNALRLMCCEAAADMFSSARGGEHMSKSLIRSQRISLLFAVIDVAIVFFPLTAHAGSGFFGANRGAVLIYIDKTDQQMTVSLDGVERYRWPVSTGRAGYSTPSGTYTPTSMNEIWYSKEWDNAPMPHAIFFMRDGHAIHGSYEVNNLGRPVSHGCVRISPGNAAILYDLVQENGMENTKVVLTGSISGRTYNIARGRKHMRRDSSQSLSDAPYYDRSPGYDQSPWSIFRW
jgi:L,D-transpeptidase catalytic domain